MKALKVFSSNKNLKTILAFSAGVFSSLFVVIAITAFSDSYASKTTINDLPKVSVPIYVNNLKTDLDSYVVNGRTYVSLSELSKYTHLEVLWWEPDSSVRVSDSSQLIFKNIDGKRYIDMSGWFGRYPDNPGVDTPNFPYKFSHNSISFPDGKVLGIPMKGIGLSEWVLDYDYFLEHVLPILPDVIEANEKVILEHKANKNTITEIKD